MNRMTKIQPEFVTFAPKVLEPGVVYVSIEYSTVLHACCCGCGNKVVTPLAPGRWHLTFDGETISLNHSIGNWSFPCQSHYWIENNMIIWDRRFSRAEIARVRAVDRYSMHNPKIEATKNNSLAQSGADEQWWRRILNWLIRE